MIVPDKIAQFRRHKIAVPLTEQPTAKLDQLQHEAAMMLERGELKEGVSLVQMSDGKWWEIAVV